jgi:hypothetical protein
MPTKISTEYLNRSIPRKEIRPFYCKENPLDVFRTLTPEHHVKKLLGLETPFSTTSMKKNFWIYGLNINSFKEKEGLEVGGSLKDFTTNVPQINQECKIKIIDGLVGRYLVDSKIENVSSSIIRGRNRIFGTPKIINYFETKKKKIDPLQRVISWKSEVMSVKRVKSGEFIGYGTSYLAKNNMKIATIPLGYSHGYSRSLSNQGRVLIDGQRCEVVGTINMNM